MRRRLRAASARSAGAVTPTAASAPVLNGRLIGVTYHAIAAVRDRLLAASGLTFPQSVVLKAVADGSSTPPPSTA
ncbi:hypothetical protein [Streptomyces sp. NPDC057686]|uniref:hypothetical protein n=1 Tax=Streptomyces sp. NPDC057686 TaxID=3346212 RepID=UPI0036828CA6